LSYADGDKYIGEWKDGKKSGKGELVYINGDKFRYCVCIALVFVFLICVFVVRVVLMCSVCVCLVQ